MKIGILALQGDFLAHGLACVFAGINVLVHTLLADLLSIQFGGDKFHLARIDQGPFHIADEGVHIDMFVAKVAYLTDDYRGLLRMCLLEIAQPCPREHIRNHFLGDQLRVGVVPVAAEIANLVGRNALHLGGASAQGQYRREQQ